MVLFVFRKLILQKRMVSHPVGLYAWFLVGPFAYFHTSCVRTAKALARLHVLWKISMHFQMPCHEIMVLFVFRKLILQKRMVSHPVGLYAWFLVGLFAYFHTSCVRTAKALARLPCALKDFHAFPNGPCHEIMVLFVFRKLAIQWGYMPDFWSDFSPTSILHVCEQRRLWRDCVDAQASAQARLSLRWSHVC